MEFEKYNFELVKINFIDQIKDRLHREEQRKE